LGAWDPLAAAAARTGLVIERVTHPLASVKDAVAVFEPPDATEPVEAASIRLAVAQLLEGHGAGLVTGPIHKARLARRGFPFTGHTDFLAHLCGDRHEPVMAFVGGRLRVALVTVHVPLSRVPELITPPRVLHTIRTAHLGLIDLDADARKRIVVCGLNPHAGDDGVLGHEDGTHIAPAVQQAQAEGIDAIGPISAEAAFRQAMDGQADMVIAMYHDQGLAPLKAVDFGKSVNWTLGLPIIRTSVDHGTADDIVGTGRAKPDSMVAALRLADQLTR
jgi:4-hydroxythreonine-4-phosphate dehydrogenase